MRGGVTWSHLSHSRQSLCLRSSVQASSKLCSSWNHIIHTRNIFQIFYYINLKHQFPQLTLLKMDYQYEIYRVFITKFYNKQVFSILKLWNFLVIHTLLCYCKSFIKSTNNTVLLFLYKICIISTLDNSLKYIDFLLFSVKFWGNSPG
jgi:hypothetical protein